MTVDSRHRVTPEHLGRTAYIYVRQSTLPQVQENRESRERQYALRDRAVALGWPLEKVVVIDEDQGHSGASTSGRLGFQRLAGEVGMGCVGAVIGLEVSRLARDDADWAQLVKICSLTRTLIIDEDGVYDPCDFNDWMLLGFKGMMSGAELHVLRARLQGGLLNKARRGELRTRLPVGFRYREDGKVILDPDPQVQATLRHFFQLFEQSRSARGVVKRFRAEGCRFPRRIWSGPRSGELIWGPLDHARTLELLHNPRYAGAFFYGRRQSRWKPAGGRESALQPLENWYALVQGVHPGYVSWERYQANLTLLRENAAAHGRDRRRSPPREGPALLQGKAVCGICGMRMTVRYGVRKGEVRPSYACQREGIRTGQKICQLVAGWDVDAAVGRLLVATVTPMALEVALEVEREVEERWKESDRLHQAEVERTQYEANLARRRFLAVDPENRRVGAVLEAEWNARLRDLEEAQKHYEEQKTPPARGAEERERILSLAKDFPRLWKDARTTFTERKRMLGLLVEDVTLVAGEKIAVHVRFRGGATESLTVPRPPTAIELRRTRAEAVRRLDQLLEERTDGEAADSLNAEDLLSGTGKRFTRRMVIHLRYRYRLPSFAARLRAQGWMKADVLGRRLGLCTGTVKVWRRQGLLVARRSNDKGDWLYAPPKGPLPGKGEWKRRWLEKNRVGGIQ